MSWSSLIPATSFMPIQATEIAKEVDLLYAFLIIASLVSFVILVGGMTWFLIKFKRTSLDQKSAYITHNNFAEFLWSFIPLIIMMGIFYWGMVIFEKLRNPPEDIAAEIHVTAEQWAWTYRYANGKEFYSSANDPMIVPAGKATKLVLTSKDVIHSFFVPAFRTKQDAVPGKLTQLWFEPKQPGEYIVFCTEYCGTKHSGMMIKIKAIPSEEYAAWYHAEKKGADSPADLGKTLFAQKACASCHSIDGSRIVGPTMKGLFGSSRKFADGSQSKADENYLRESILVSSAKIVEGYPPAMPVFQGQLSDEDVANLIEYIKSIK
ncbi:cytochrome c oxidase subunit II [Leptospira bandrabouensis]|uniref:Cytochrome c oxidase subunit 2 n=1 Tax=Leptospira bandrabouensis TaxID=2484903 RepID=A0A6H3NYL0_9LEPT|nr:cytochrome c oxidase subunit II [Leptospira bandrabouensis]MCG6146011.1 cytochrome c oxidase subunit II [Leptospira bandrabouensis]MCG6153574.1 cytochrome c oxidase subunit II [Leptospira bandrabouensis]MCG6165598.1 cytochrome c oxidase subunit II [Leptospira bandrabouensis]MCW7458446.1 cytochrome c oxidase subunit II [Leptospira bandrabouensis]MCW7478807.1 cytochrome c oxidase subunit II [Leptospira bandrabouensis]